jgi:hypothetical protein
MEEQIKKLKKLADEYADFVGRTPIEHLTVFEYSKDYSEKLSVYFTKISVNAPGFNRGDESAILSFGLQCISR